MSIWLDSCTTLLHKREAIRTPPPLPPRGHCTLATASAARASCQSTLL